MIQNHPLYTPWRALLRSLRCPFRLEVLLGLWPCRTEIWARSGGIMNSRKGGYPGQISRAGIAATQKGRKVTAVMPAPLLRRLATTSSASSTVEMFRTERLVARNRPKAIIALPDDTTHQGRLKLHHNVPRHGYDIGANKDAKPVYPPAPS